ncbi:15136_t:CDS:2 [Dentiscutata erythropus]|uniref:15136_t:CDS:1 n=1 Tax=Dentiscutata erythropus TaxID=1348616 RepID=A0A9N9J3U0_9GLOM|nr:15136_t:CDS:2 [Dentiscutata erythropus]
MIRSVAKFEKTSQGKLHTHCVLTFARKVTMKFVKQLVDCQRISFPPGVLCKGTSKDNEDYVLKIWGRCAIYHKPREGKYCKCSLSVKEDISKCTLCKRSCIEKRKKKQLEEEGAGPFIFGKFRFLEGASDDTVDKLNMIRLDNEYKKEKIRDDKLDSDYLLLHSELHPTTFYDSYQKNFLFYSDSGSGKTSLIQKISKALVKGRDICKKANDPFQDLLNLCEKDECIIKQRNKKPIEVVSKYNIFTAQDLFDDIFSFRKCFFDNRVYVKSKESRIALYRRFSKSLLESDQPGDMLDFINSRFHIKFVEDVNIEEAKKYVYDDDFENLYEYDGDVFMKREIDMNVVLGGVIGNIDVDNQSFTVYNRYWNSELPYNIMVPDNIELLHKNLRNKFHWVDKKPINFIKNNTELIVLDPQIESSKCKLDDTEIEDREKEKHVKLDDF